MPSWPTAIGLWFCMALGFCSHLSFVLVYGALLVWTLWRCLSRRCLSRPLHLGRAGRAMLRLHLVPAIFLMLLAGDRVLYPRFLLTSVAFFLMVLGRCLGRLLLYGPKTRLTALALLLLVCAGNMTRIVPFLQVGRGSYAEAITYMVENTPVPEVVVGADFDVRSGYLLEYYWPRLRRNKRLRFVPNAPQDPMGPDWFLTHYEGEDPRPRTQLMLPSGHAYTLMAGFPFYGPSGWHWSLYLRAR